MKQTFTQLLCVTLLLLTAGMASAQTILSEDFDNGIPTGWTTQDSSVNNVLWEACAGPNSACVNLYGLPPFASTTAANGFVVLDSDAAGDLGENDHNSFLTTSAINCSAVSQVFVSFESYIAVFHTTTTIAFRVSNDGVNWTSYDVIPPLAANAASSNPYISAINISEVAANKATVYLQWQWIGNNEYWWMLDDVVVTSLDPTPDNDLVLGDFFYPASSYATPESQIDTDTFGFYAYVSNRGLADQTNVTLFAFIFDENNDILFEDSVAIDVLPAGYVDTLLQLPNQFVPDLTIGAYTVVYVVAADGADARPDDNADGDVFEVTDNVFAKESEPTTANRPNVAGNYAFANLYQMSSGSLDNYKATSFDFSSAVNPNTVPIGDLVVSLYLFKVNDDVLPDFSNFDETAFISPSLEWLAYTSYEYPDDAVNFELQTSAINDLNTGAESVELENGARYLAAVEYTDANNVAFHSTSDETSHYFLSSLFYNDASGWSTFGPDFNPVIRMHIDLVTATDENPLPETAFNVLPNPIQTVLNLQVAFDKATDATITLADISGRVIKIDNRKGLTSERLSYDVPQLANGTYIARIATKEGTSTKKFVVQK